MQTTTFTKLVLPVEITDAIIDHLHDDRPALHNCALVNRTWLNASRYHLFRTITISRRRSNACCAGPLDFLSATPEVACHIRYLSLAHDDVSVSTLAELLSLLPKVRSLSLSQLAVGIACDYSKQPPRLPCIEELKVASCNLNFKIPLLLSFLNLFRSIRRLEISVDIRVLNLSPSSAIHYLPPPRLALSHLSAFHIPLSAVSQLIMETRTKETLRVLWYDDTFLDWPDVEELGSILKTLGPSKCLKRLIFGPLNIFTPYYDNFPPDQDAEDIGRWPALNLECCEGLEEFSLRTRMLLQVQVDIFAHLPQSVHTIWVTFIGIDKTVADPGADSEWAAFDAAFSGKEYQRLRLVLDMSRVKNTTEETQYSQMVDRAMKGLHTVRAQGRLVIHEEQREWWKGF